LSRIRMAPRSECSSAIAYARVVGCHVLVEVPRRCQCKIFTLTVADCRCVRPPPLMQSAQSCASSLEWQFCQPAHCRVQSRSPRGCGFACGVLLARAAPQIATAARAACCGMVARPRGLQACSSAPRSRVHAVSPMRTMLAAPHAQCTPDIRSICMCIGGNACFTRLTHLHWCRAAFVHFGAPASSACARVTFSPREALFLECCYAIFGQAFANARARVVTEC